MVVRSFYWLEERYLNSIFGKNSSYFDDLRHISRQLVGNENNELIDARKNDELKTLDPEKKLFLTLFETPNIIPTRIDRFPEVITSRIIPFVYSVMDLAPKIYDFNRKVSITSTLLENVYKGLVGEEEKVGKPKRMGSLEKYFGNGISLEAIKEESMKAGKKQPIMTGYV